MRINGATYKAIGEHFGVTRQRAHEIIHRHNGRLAIGTRYSGFPIEDIVFQGIYEHFLNNTRETMSSFTKKVYGQNGTASIQRLRNFLIGKHETYLRIKQVKKICEVCGKPFEEVFKERERK